jgi:exopolyphosphatase/guanosine-5'-triphosphate,3'-diphosphate pyrophosphatase
MRITRLGQGVDRENRLAPDAIARTVDVLREFRVSMDAFAVGRTRMVATSAVRDAQNGAAFVEAATDAVGVALEVLSGSDEGRLAYQGASADLEPFGGDTLVVDIGGGSTELTLGRGDPVASISLQLGCVRLTERCLIGDPPTPEEIAATRVLIEETLDWAEEQMPALRALDPARRLVGLAGTVSTLAALKLGIAEYDQDRLHHATISLPEVSRLCETLASLSAHERSGLVGMAAGREDVILGGALILEMVLSRYRFAEVIASERDILDGIAVGLR